MAFKYLLKVQELEVLDKDPNQTDIPGTEDTGKEAKRVWRKILAGDILEIMMEIVVKVYVFHYEPYAELQLIEVSGGEEKEIQSWKGKKPVGRAR